MKLPNMNLNIRKRLILGFFGLCVILAFSTGVTVLSLLGVADKADRITNLRVPTAAASASLVNNVNASLANLRGWMLTGNPAFKVGRAAVWEDIEGVVEDMNGFSASWTNPANIATWTELKVVLEEFRGAQRQVEDIANSIDEQPASRILVQDAAPRAKVLMQEITAMIDEELALEATPARKALLGIMADVRGSTAISLANIRAYLLSGNDNFRTAFEGSWAKNEKRFADLGASSRLFTQTQSAAFERFGAARAEFAPLPPQMFEIRGSDKWNMANFTLITKAAPRAGKILDALSGIKDEQGVRQGGMVANQAALLTNDANENAADIAFLQMIAIGLLAVGLAVAAAIAFITSRAIVNPIKSMTSAMAVLATGDFTADVPARDRTDEIGEMAKSVQVFKDNGIEREQLEKAQAAERAEKEQRASRVDQLARDFESAAATVLGDVTSAADQVKSSATSMSATADQTNQQSIAVAAASEEASSNVATVAAASEELASSITEISRQVEQSTKMSTKAVSEAEAANATVQGLADAARGIGDVVELINNIASQTNLLALNATIEAARAGEAGKGFAVVASEVKSLASQTAKATEEISSQITSIQEESNSAVGAIDGIRQVISEVDEIAGAIAAAVEEQGAATQEIARNVQQAAEGTQEVSSNIAGVTQAANETGQAATQVLEISESLTTQAGALRKDVEQFLADLKSA
ncbi:MAG: HAMP domain-containing methyl-accepting chemotaxis protein [Alphaproteobacteria bacterium]